MTDTIPPCPVCGTVPQKCGSTLACVTCDTNFMNSLDWKERCEIILGRNVMANNIHTLAQLTERLAPDPRVAVLEKTLTDLRERHTRPHNFGDTHSNGCDCVECNYADGVWQTANDALQLIAAQRGEG